MRESKWLNLPPSGSGKFHRISLRNMCNGQYCRVVSIHAFFAYDRIIRLVGRLSSSSSLVLHLLESRISTGNFVPALLFFFFRLFPFRRLLRVSLWFAVLFCDLCVSALTIVLVVWRSSRWSRNKTIVDSSFLAFFAARLNAWKVLNLHSSKATLNERWLSKKNATKERRRRRRSKQSRRFYEANVLRPIVDNQGRNGQSECEKDTFKCNEIKMNRARTNETKSRNNIRRKTPRNNRHARNQ